MPKGYWISTYRAIRDESKVAAYAKLAGPAIAAGGGRTLAGGVPAHVFELGQRLRTVLIEFPSVEAAYATHEGPGYQEALAALGDAVDRDQRIIAGIE
jgi:uncharacterized protein (DUF1330 family)